MIDDLLDRKQLKADLPVELPKTLYEERICGWCGNLFKYEQRTQAEAEWLRKALMITAPQFDPIICEPCYNRSMGGLSATLDAHAINNFCLR